MIPPEPNDTLGRLAREFRGTKDEEKRKEIAERYAACVAGFIRHGDFFGEPWKEIPAMEDQLPDEYMPQEFFEFWKIR